VESAKQASPETFPSIREGKKTCAASEAGKATAQNVHLEKGRRKLKKKGHEDYGNVRSKKKREKKHHHPTRPRQ